MHKTEEIANLLYNDHLCDVTKDFLETIKSNEYNNLDNKLVFQINTSDNFQELICNNTTELGNTKRYKLNEGDKINSDQIDLLKKIYSKRKSTRTYDKAGITFNELSALLKTSYYNVGDNIFYNPKTKKSKKLHPRRNIATGGGLYPVDVYIINLKIPEIPKGIYYYNVDDESIEAISNFEDDNQILGSFFTKDRTDIEFERVSVFVIFVGNLNRVALKYRDRGILFTIIDVGALMQSFYIASAVLEIGCCGNGGYYDDNLHHILKLQSNQQMVLGTMTIGKI